jgi:hypothetical protein
MTAQAQLNWAKQYEQAKVYIDESRYDAALEILAPVMKEQKGNDYALHSQYLYAYVAFQQGKFLSAKDILLQLKLLHADWTEIDKVNWLLASVYAKLTMYRNSVLSIQFVPLTYTDVSAWKKEYYPLIKPIDTLAAIQKAVPFDVELAEELYRRLTTNLSATTATDKLRVAALEKEYGFNKTALVKPMVSVIKDRYHVAVLFPFQLKEMNATASARNNQFIYDLYAGIKIATDSLNKDHSKAPVEIHAYDTEKDINKVKEIIKSKEWESIDLIIGPVFTEQYTYIKDQPEVQQKILFNPTSAHSKYADKAGTYLYKASVESTVSAMATYATLNFSLRKNLAKDPGLIAKKDVVILFGKEVKDSVMAYLYRDSIVKKGFLVKKFLKVDTNYMGVLRTMASDSLGLLKISHIVTLSSDPVFAANFISLMEITQQYIPMYAYSDWLDNTQLSYVQMEKRGVHFIYPDYVRIDSDVYKRFYKAYLSTYNVFPSVYAIQGYEMMTLLGNALREGGTDISVSLNKKSYFSLGMLGGYDYSTTNYNKFVPLVAFKDMKLTVVNELK